MKRYRWLSFFVDTRRNLVREPPYSSDPMATSGAVGSVGFEHGLLHIQTKYSRWLDLAPPALCAPVIYHELLLEVESAFVHGDPFPALTAACCLGERILNHLVLDLRDDFRTSPRYKEVHNKESFQDWHRAISVLSDWGVLSDDLATKFKTLLELRNPAVHFGSVQDRSNKAKKAVQLVYDVTAGLFGPKAGHFFMAPGEMYVCRDKETSALVRRFVLPHCVQVGYRHTIQGQPPNLRVRDDDPYDGEDIDDEEFTRRRTAFRESADAGKGEA